MNRLGIPVLPSVVNAAVLVSIFSTTNSFVFAASRSLLGMAQHGQAPKILARTSKRGVPYVAILLTLAVGCLSYMSVSAGSVKVLNWWINLVTAAQLVSWTCIAMYVVCPAGGLAVELVTDRPAPTYASARAFSPKNWPKAHSCP